MNIKIIYEDKHIIVCKKPSGVSSQTERGFDPDMVSILMNHLHNAGESRPYIGVIHRLDKPVSGVMVYAKTKVAAATLSKELSGNGFNKRYYAIVMDNEDFKKNTTNTGETYAYKPLSSGTLENYLLHDVKSNSSSVVEVSGCLAGDNAKTAPSTKGAKLARLNYRFLRRDTIEGVNLALLDIELLTGRHHQIRVQLSHAGYPILGDMRYNKSLSEKLPYKLKKAGLALCAYSLSLTHPVTKEVMEFTDIPDENIWKNMCIKG